MSYSLLVNEPLMTIVETPTFLKSAKVLLTDAEKDELLFYLANNPLAGDIMPETGGVRKLRWAREGEGKSGGYRVIYYFHSESIPLFAILIYGKNQKANLTKAEKNTMKKLTAILAEYGSTRQ